MHQMLILSRYGHCVVSQFQHQVYGLIASKGLAVSRFKSMKFRKIGFCLSSFVCLVSKRHEPLLSHLDLIILLSLDALLSAL